MPNKGRRLRILVVEDDPDQRIMMRRLLGLLAPDAAITTTSSVVGAIIAMVKDRVDIAFVDWLLKGDFPLTGLHVAKWLHEACPTTRLVILTGYPRHQIEIEGHSIPEWVLFLEKPVKQDVLIAILDEVGTHHE